MGKFCTKCGRPLQDGQICVCQMSAGMQNPKQPDLAGGQFQPQQPYGQGSQASGMQGMPGGQGADMRQNASGRRIPPYQQGMPGSGYAAGQQGTPGSGYAAGQQGMPGSGYAAGQQGMPGSGYAAGQQGTPGSGYAAGQQGMPGSGYAAGQQGMPSSGYAAGQQGMPGGPYSQYGAGSQTPPRYGTGRQFSGQAAAYTQNFLQRMLTLLKSPVTAGRRMIREADVKMALLFIVFQGLFSGIFAMAVGQKCSSYIKAASGLADGISSGMGNAVSSILAIPYFRIFIITVLFSLALACILALLLMLGNMAMKVSVTFPQMLSAAAVRSVVMVPMILFSLLIFELFAGAGLVLFVLTNIVGFSAIIMAAASFAGKDKIDFYVFMMSGVIFLFVIIAFFAFSKLWTLYLPDMLRASLETLNGMSTTELLEEIFDSF